MANSDNTYFFKTTVEAGKGTTTFLSAPIFWNHLNELGLLGLEEKFVEFLYSTLELGVASALSHGFTPGEIRAVPGLAPLLDRIADTLASDPEGFRVQVQSFLSKGTADMRTFHSASKFAGRRPRIPGQNVTLAFFWNAPANPQNTDHYQLVLTGPDGTSQPAFNIPGDQTSFTTQLMDDTNTWTATLTSFNGAGAACAVPAMVQFVPHTDAPPPPLPDDPQGFGVTVS